MTKHRDTVKKALKITDFELVFVKLEILFILSVTLWILMLVGH